MAIHIRRREFVAALGSAAAWPFVVRAQQHSKQPTIGYLGPTVNDARTAAFADRLRELGWIDGRTVAIEYRYSEGHPERVAEIAAEFVRQDVDVIVTYGGAVTTVKQPTATIPIVFAMATDPVRIGLVASLSRPGGNVTGISVQQAEIAGKRLELLRDVVPGLRRLAIIFDGGYSAAVLESGAAQGAARTLGLEVMAHEIGARRISRPPLKRSTVAPMHFMWSAILSHTLAGFASAPWRSRHDCRRSTIIGISSRPAA